MSQEGGGGDGAHALDLLETLGLGVEIRIGGDEFGDPVIDLLDLAIELTDQSLGLGEELLEGEMVQAIEFGGACLDQLSAAAGELPESPLGGGGRRVGSRSELEAEIGQFEGVDGIGPGLGRARNRRSIR
jgi:hypothetical protein